MDNMKREGGARTFERNSINLVDKNMVRNSGVGLVFAIWTMLLFPEVRTYMAGLTTKDADFFIAIISVITLPLFGYLIYQIMMATLGWWLLYRDEARHMFSEKLATEGFNSRFLPLGDPQLVWKYYLECEPSSRARHQVRHDPRQSGHLR